MQRLALTYFTMCVHVEHGLAQFINYAVNCACCATSIHELCSNSTLCLKFRMGLFMMAMIPAEINALNVDSNSRNELQHVMHELCESRIFACLEQILQLLGAPTFPQFASLYLPVLKVFHSWFQFYGMTLTKVVEYNVRATEGQVYGTLFNALVLPLNTAYWSPTSPAVPVSSVWAALVEESLAILTAVIPVAEYPPPALPSDTLTPSRYQVVALLVQNIHTMIGLFTTVDATEEDDMEGIYRGITECVVALISEETDYVAAPISTNGLEIGLLSFKALLWCTSIKPRKISLLTFDAWASLQDIPMEERHVYLQKEVFLVLFETLLGQITYPMEILKTQGSDVGDDDVVDFRNYDNGIQDTLLLCLVVLQEVPFIAILSRLLDVQEVSVCWLMKLELVLYVLHCCMIDLKRYIVMCI